MKFKVHSPTTVNHSVQQIVANKDVEIRIDTTVKTDIKIKYKPDIVVVDKKNKLIRMIEIGVTSKENLQQKTLESISLDYLRIGDEADEDKAMSKSLLHVGDAKSKPILFKLEVKQH
ncbi:uncharacterized protein VNE69_09154 [Vairimorpha necatrix]|uniref:Uncharacterized protein n=1 Tax=Vairimorpha necatrix TaxID=6039 RepID=A0AAX4JF65_9MICR